MQRLFMAVLAGLLISGTTVNAGESKVELQKTSDASFSQDVLNSKQPVFLDFYTTWCGPCKTMEPLVSKLADDYKGKIKVLSIDAEKNPIVTEKYAITVYPSYCVFVNGKMTVKQFGTKTEDGLKQMLTLAHAI